jgi:hypothetical protein
MSESVGVSPIGVMFAVFAGGELFGVPGLLLGIPAAALVKVLFKYFVQPYVLQMQFADGLPSDLLVENAQERIDADARAAAAADLPPPAEPPVAVPLRARSRYVFAPLT